MLNRVALDLRSHLLQKWVINKVPFKGHDALQIWGGLQVMVIAIVLYADWDMIALT